MVKVKRALLVGINYRGTRSELQGCINDVLQVKAFLLTQGYKEKYITVLTDDTDIQPTRANILKYFLELILSGAETLYWHYSGHGGSVVDVSGDEADGLDETLCPIDYAKKGMIIDDEIRGLLPCLNPAQHLTVVIDACHSLSSCDLKWNVYERFGGRRLVLVADENYTDTKGQVVMLSGALDSQTAADAYIDGKFQGAMTYAFLKCYPESKTYEQLLKNIRALLRKERYTQIPNLAAGRNFDLRLKLRV
uniref:Caspase n=1 Tax=Pithovirus LCPAC304 TaxID=2506594 RepID=A0A481Z8X8_9VIRU|nr:MAG: caspase [Pithovirus LCPAC304]